MSGRKFAEEHPRLRRTAMALAASQPRPAHGTLRTSHKTRGLVTSSHHLLPRRRTRSLHLRPMVPCQAPPSSPRVRFLRFHPACAFTNIPLLRALRRPHHLRATAVWPGECITSQHRPARRRARRACERYGPGRGEKSVTGGFNTRRKKPCCPRHSQTGRDTCRTAWRLWGSNSRKISLRISASRASHAEASASGRLRLRHRLSTRVRVVRSLGVRVGRSHGVRVGRSPGVSVGRSPGVSVVRMLGVSVGRSLGVQLRRSLPYAVAMSGSRRGTGSRATSQHAATARRPSGGAT